MEPAGKLLPRASGPTAARGLSARAHWRTPPPTGVRSRGGARATGASPRAPWAGHASKWRRAQRHGRRLPGRIVQAGQARKKRQARALPFRLPRARSGRAVALKRVTENHGNRTPGVDQILGQTPEKKAAAVAALRPRAYPPHPVKRGYMPQSAGRKRALSIPPLKARARQALPLLALAPIADTTADPNSSGFRQRRSAADALSQGYGDLAKTTAAQGILAGDIRACFDELSPEGMLAHIPMERGTRGKWLKAGDVEHGGWQPTETGAPQGGIISPALGNLTLEGLEHPLKEKLAPTQRSGKQPQVHLVRDADACLITRRTRELLGEEVKPVVARFRAERGLELSPTKTRLTHRTEGVDLLGTHIRKYDGKLVRNPSRKSVKQVRKKITTGLTRNRHAGVKKLVGRLNPLLTGWANYPRPWRSKETLQRVDHEITRKVGCGAQRNHPTKSGGWLTPKYFSARAPRSGDSGPTRTQADGKKQTIWLAKAPATPMRRPVKIRPAANPSDPAWETYCEARAGQQLAEDLQGRRQVGQLWREQQGRCPMCAQQLTTATGWTLQHLHGRVKGGTAGRANLVLLPPNCHRQVHSRNITVVKPRPVKRALAKA